MPPNPAPNQAATSGRRDLLVLLLCLAAVMAVLFHRSFGSDEILFNNDLSYGTGVALGEHGLGVYSGFWQDLNWLGSAQVTPPPSISRRERTIT